MQADGHERAAQKRASRWQTASQAGQDDGKEPAPILAARRNVGNVGNREFSAESRRIGSDPVSALTVTPAKAGA